MSENWLDAKPMLLNLRNGTLDLESGELRRHDAGDLLTKVTPAAFHEWHRCPVWERFLEDVLPDAELRTFFQRLMGYALQGGQTEKCFAIVYGPPDGGKSTALNAIMRALGVSRRTDEVTDDDSSAVVTRYYAESAEIRTFTANRNDSPNRPDLVKLMGARLVLINEIRGERLEAGLVKQWTGGDMVKGAPKYGNPITFWPDGTLIFVGNERPTIAYEDDAMWERTILVPFTSPVPEQKRDRGLIDKFDRDGVLSWLVEGHRAYVAGGLQVPEICRLARQEYRSEIDTLADFWNERVEAAGGDRDGEQARVGRGEMFSAYRDWSRVVELPRDEVVKQLKLTQYINRRVSEIETVEVVDKGSWRGWRGLRLVDPGEREKTTASDDFKGPLGQ